MKITIEEEGKEPKTYSNIKAYRLLMVGPEKTTSVGHGNDRSFETAISLAQIIDREYQKFSPLIDFLHKMQESTDNEAPLEDGD